MITYSRVLPRDLFNEAKLLKCMGKLTLAIEDGFISLEYKYSGGPFHIQQGSDGDLTCLNITFEKGLTFHTPLNARTFWPLVCVTGEYEYIDVFKNNRHGVFTEEFIELLDEK